MSTENTTPINNDVPNTVVSVKSAEPAAKKRVRRPTVKNAATKTSAKTATKTAAKPATKASTKTASKAASKTKVKPVEVTKVKKPKLVRDSFTFPKDEYQAIAALKQKALGLKHSAKKSEILRAGLKLLSSLNDKAFLAALVKVPALKTGRPAKS